MSTVAFPKDAIMTYTGKIIRPLDPDPDQIVIEDIAHSLSNQCRFTGHTSEFYSTAQHSVHVSDLCPDEDKLWGLLHDATEAYISDIARPIKRGTEWGEAYEEIEGILMDAVITRFNLNGYATDWVNSTLPLTVRAADDMMLRTEMRDLMPAEIAIAIPPGEGAPYKIKAWSPGWAKYEFLRQYKELS